MAKATAGGASEGSDERQLSRQLLRMAGVEALKKKCGSLEQQLCSLKQPRCLKAHRRPAAAVLGEAKSLRASALNQRARKIRRYKEDLMLESQVLLNAEISRIENVSV